MFIRMLSRLLGPPLREIGAAELAEALQGARTPVLIDVRIAGQFAAGHLPGAVSIPLARLRTAAARLDPDAPTVVYCNVGGQSAIACAVLARLGFRDVTSLAGGIRAWRGPVAAGAE